MKFLGNKWSTKRRYAPTSLESTFEISIQNDGFKILKYCEHKNRTDYLVEKDGVKIKYSFKTGEKHFFDK